MGQPNDRIVYLDRARRAIRAIALSLVIAGFGATAALADVCQYSNGRRTLGPCMQFESGTGGNFDLYCLHGPTSSTHRIKMTPGDSFTCKVPESRSSVAIARTNTNGYQTYRFYQCQGQEKHIFKYITPGTNKLDGGWQWECRTLQNSLRW